MSDCQQCLVRKLNAIQKLKRNESKVIANSKVYKEIKKGEVFFREGDVLNGVYCVKSGISKLTKLSEKGKEQVVKLVVKGELLGQRSVIIDQAANLSATALNDMEVCFIPKKELVNILKSNNDFSFDVLQQMATDLKEAETTIINMAQKTVRRRLAEIVMYLFNDFGVTNQGYLTVTLSREDFASIVGTTTESIIRTLSQFKKEGFISTKSKQIKIEDYNRLETVE